MAERAEIVQGPWADAGKERLRPERSEKKGRPGGPEKIVLGMVVRECAVEIGHDPSPRELADWANHQSDGRGEYCLFGREVSPAEAAVILKHPDREVTVRPARAAPKPGLGLVAMPSRGRSTPT